MKKIIYYLPVLTIAILFAIVYLPAIREFIYDWSHDDNYSHGFLIPIVSVYIFWQEKHIINKIKTRSNWFGLVVLLLGLILYVVGTASSEWFSARFSLVVVLAGIVLYLAGKEVLKSTWFPIVFLIFMIPLPYVIYYSLTFPLQLLATKIAAFLLQCTGFAVLRQGNIIHLQNYSLEVVEACSGLRSLMTLSALGAALAYMTQENWFSGVVLFLLTIPIAIGANVFRIVLTAYGAVMISPDFADGFLHEMSGLVVFLFGFIFLGVSAVVIKWIANLKNYEPLSS